MNVCVFHEFSVSQGLWLKDQDLKCEGPASMGWDRTDERVFLWGGPKHG